MCPRRCGSGNLATDINMSEVNSSARRTGVRQASERNYSYGKLWAAVFKRTSPRCLWRLEPMRHGEYLAAVSLQAYSEHRAH